VADKVIALASRAAERGYLDTAAALGQGPGSDRRDFADAGHRIGDRAFARYGLGPQDVAGLRAQFARLAPRFSGYGPILAHAISHSERRQSQAHGFDGLDGARMRDRHARREPAQGAEQRDDPSTASLSTASKPGDSSSPLKLAASAASLLTPILTIGGIALPLTVGGLGIVFLLPD